MSKVDYCGRHRKYRENQNEQMSVCVTLDTNEKGRLAMERPKLDFSTILLLWKPDYARKIIEQVRSEKGEVKPRFFHGSLPISSTEAEKYTCELVRQICDAAFGAISCKGVPSRKQIWSANAQWLRFHIQLGKGADFEDLIRIVALYTEHVREDNPA